MKMSETFVFDLPEGKPNDETIEQPRRGRPKKSTTEKLLERKKQTTEPTEPEKHPVDDFDLSYSVDALGSLLISAAKIKKPLDTNEKQILSIATKASLSTVEKESPIFKYFPHIALGTTILGIFLPRFFPHWFGIEIPKNGVEQPKVEKIIYD